MNNAVDMKKNSALQSDAAKETILKQIAELEKIARGLEPDSTERTKIVGQAAGYIDQFINSLPSAKTYVKGGCENLKAMEIDNGGKPLEQLLNILRNEVDRVGINSASGHQLGYIPAGGIWASSIADMLAAATNRYAGVYYACPGGVIMENQLIKWLCSIVGYPSTAHGNLASGGSIANLIAIQTARDSFKINSANVKQSVIYFTEQAHHCINKALLTTGLHEAVQRIIPMNPNFQMDAEALKHVIKKDKKEGLLPCMVIATAGTTDTGAIDPLDSIADICSENKVWFHVDAAYGGFFMLVDELKDKFKGIEKSDSLVIDPHKGLFIPYGSGVVLIKNGAALLASYSHQAAYMQDAYGYDEISPADCSPELSKHFRGLRMWLPLHLHGLDVFKANLQEKILLCRYFHEGIKEMGFATGPYPELSVTLFRFPEKDANNFNQKLLDSLHDDGRCFFSSTVIKNELWIRCAVLSFRTHLPEIKLALQMIKENVEKIKKFN
jgi:glutamate/tyrosine decarboxylase-like PLP-dependent enzyme